MSRFAYGPQSSDDSKACGHTGKGLAGMGTAPILRVSHLGRHYGTGKAAGVALDDITLSLFSPGLVCVLGPSGCGKTTLLNVLGGMDTTFTGELFIEETDCRRFEPQEWDDYRARRVGFVFQDPSLTSYLTIRENVALAQELCGASRDEIGSRTDETLRQTGIEELAKRLPSQLSGGQAQRASIARAIAKAPDIILADEPTGSLDQASGEAIMRLLSHAARSRLIVVVTHNEELAHRFATRTIRMMDGRIVEDEGCITPSENLPTAKEAPVSPEATSPSNPAATSRKGHKCAMPRLAFKHLGRSRLRSALVVFTITLSVLGSLLAATFGMATSDYMDRLEVSTTLNHPLRATADPTAFVVSAKPDEHVSTPTTPVEVTVNNGGTNALRTLGTARGQSNLGFLYAQLTQGPTDIWDDVLDIQESYHVEFNLYTSDGRQALMAGNGTLAERLNVASTLGEGAAYQISQALKDRGLIREVVQNDETGDSPYQILAGHLPTSTDELVLITREDGSILDYVGYDLGLIDDERLLGTMRALARGDHEDATGALTGISYEDVIGTTYRIVPTADYYAKRDGSWVDSRDDAAYVANVLASARRLTVVGVIRPLARYASESDIGAIGYAPGLPKELIDDAWHTRIVQEQAAHPDTNVFTGRTFADEASAKDPSFDDTAVARLVSVAGELGLSQHKIDALKILNPEQVRAVCEVYGIALDEAQEAGANAVSSDDAEALRQMSDDEFFQLIEENAPPSLNSHYAQNMEWLGGIDVNSPKALLIYPKNSTGRRATLDAVDAFSAALPQEAARVQCQSDLHEWLDQVATTVGNVSKVLAIFVTVSLVLGVSLIFSSTYVSALERRREIALLRAMGASRRDVMRLFAYENGLLGTLSGIVGLVAATIGLPLLSTYVTQVAESNVPMTLPPWAPPAAVAGAIGLAVLAGWIPASRCSQRNPASLLRAP